MSERVPLPIKWITPVFDAVAAHIYISYHLVLSPLLTPTQVKIEAAADGSVGAEKAPSDSP